MPRMATWLWPGPRSATYRPGTLRAISTRLVAPDCLMSSLVTAATENGTSCSAVARFCAVTVITSVISSSVGAGGFCAHTANGRPSSNAATPREIPVFMRPLLAVSGAAGDSTERPTPPTAIVRRSIHPGCDRGNRRAPAAALSCRVRLGSRSCERLAQEQRADDQGQGRDDDRVPQSVVDVSGGRHDGERGHRQETAEPPVAD